VHHAPWNDPGFEAPAEIFTVTGMLNDFEKRMLYWVTLNRYAGWGAILDMGSYLGGSTICFAAGLRERGLPGPIHAYDFFRLGPFELERDFADNPPPELKTRHIFDENLRDYRDLLVVHEGNLLETTWTEGPIEILFVDIAKTPESWDHVTQHYFSALAPGSLVILQDYLYPESGAWHHVVMEKLAPYFDYAFDTGVNSAGFVLRRELPAVPLWTEIPADEKLALMERAIERMDTEEKKERLRSCRRVLLDGISAR
jgi:predicted O-methyltransferase YrrM